MLRVRTCQNEPTRFFVESNSLSCCNPECSKTFNRHQHPGIHIGDKCPRCGGQLDLRFHTVEISEFNGTGFCSCEYFTFRLAPELKLLSPQQRIEKGDLLRCSHIKAARDFALDLALHLHNHQDKNEK
jgi:hypothetical protein